MSIFEISSVKHIHLSLKQACISDKGKKWTDDDSYISK